MSLPENITPTFSIATPYILKAYRGETITAKDFTPLSKKLQTQYTYDAFEEMLISEGIIRQVPLSLWRDICEVIAAPPAKRTKRTGQVTKQANERVSEAAAKGRAVSALGDADEEMMASHEPFAISSKKEPLEKPSRSEKKKKCFPFDFLTNVDRKVLKKMRDEAREINAQLLSEEGTFSSLAASLPSQHCVTLPASDAQRRELWARLAVALSADKPRLFLSQEGGVFSTSLLFLIIRAISWDLLLGMFLGVVRTCAVMAQVIVLWILVRLANRDEALGDWHWVLRCLLALILPLGALVQSFGQHNTFHATNNAAIKARSLILALVYEKLRVMTPLYMGSASGERRVAQKKKGEDNGGNKKEAQPPPPAQDASLAEPILPSPDGSAAKDTYANTIATITDTSPVSSGLLINLIASDANTILEAALMLPLGLSTILDLVACLVWVGILAGWATAILFCAMFLIFLFQVLCGYRVSKNKLAVAHICDQRLRALTEFLTGIQVVKFYAWEANVRRMIKALRASEALLLVEGNSWKLIGLTSTFCAPGLFYLCLFGVRSTYESEMDAITTFTVMALLSTNVNRTFQVLPRSLTVVGTTSASMKRIVEFLRKDVTSGLPVTAAFTKSEGAKSEKHSQQREREAEKESGALPNAEPRKDDDKKDGLYIAGDFGWPGFTLKGLDLHCPPSTLTVIIGAVGSGKSTLLQAVMGMCAAMSEKYTLMLPEVPSGDSNTKDDASKRPPRIAYVSQEAFIAEGSVRENITFGLPFEEAKYRSVIKACSLVTDIQQWGGDLVEVSTNTLSGGQRQRLSLARACYADAALYVIDDPISAVDASVGRHLLKKCFRGYLASKTVLLATHHPAPARFADQIVILEAGAAPKVRRVGNTPSRRTSPQLCPIDGNATAHQGDDDDEHDREISEVLARMESQSNNGSFQKMNLDDDDDEACGVTGETLHRHHLTQDELHDQILDSLLGKARALKVVEAEAVGGVPMSVYLAYCRGGGWALLVCTFLLFLISQTCRTGGDWWFSAWSDAAYSPQLSDTEYLWIYAIIVGALIVFACIRTLAFGFFTIRASSSLHDKMFEAVIASPLYFFEQVPLGRIMNRFSKDLDYCDDLLPRVLFDLVQMIFMVCGSLTMQIYSVPWFAIAIPIAMVLFVLLLRLYMPASRYIKRIESTSRSPSLNTFQTVMSGLTTLRMYGRMDDYRKVYYDYCDITINAMLHSSCFQRWIAVRMDLISAMWSLCASVLCAALMHSMGASIVGLCLSQSVFLAGLFQFAVRMATETEMMMTSVERLDEYGNLPPEANEGIRKDAEALRLDAEAAGGAAAVVNAQPLPDRWPAGCDIVVKGLTVSHYSNPDAVVLKNLHFTIRAGQRVAVVGRTGAGKSTLLSAFFHTLSIPKDSITIGGVSTTDVDVFSLRSKLGIIPQVPTLFHGTFRYNLDPFDRYSDDAMLAALKKVQLIDYVSARAGLDTPVGEGGGNLSVGQRQLLCAARVLLTGATILFMDEATANIDEDTDEQIQAIMREESKRSKMTIVTIAHRLNTILDYDLVLVLSQGRLVEVGNPRALVETGVGFGGFGGADDDSDAETPFDFTDALKAASLGGMSSADFTTHVETVDECHQFAKMVIAMNEARNEH